MRSDYDLLCTSPPDEPCVQGDADPRRAREEGRRYIELLRRVIGREPDGSELKVRSNPHDFGAYHTVVYFFEEGCQDHIAYMRRIENDGPLTWDEEGKFQCLPGECRCEMKGMGCPERHL